jgi:hypothetical protein
MGLLGSDKPAQDKSQPQSTAFDAGGGIDDVA